MLFETKSNPAPSRLSQDHPRLSSGTRTKLFITRFKRVAGKNQQCGLVLGACLLLSVVMGVALRYATNSKGPAPVQILGQYRASGLWRDRLFSWVPITPAWAWAWRFQNALFGQRKPVNISTRFFALRDLPNPHPFGLGRPTFSNTNGTDVWLVSRIGLKQLRKSLEAASGSTRLPAANFSTGDGIGGTLSQGQPILVDGVTNDVGLVTSFFPRVRPESIDLTAALRLTCCLTNQPSPASDTQPVRSVQTNLNLAVELQIPKGSGVFLLHHMAESGTSTGVILDAR